MGQLATRHDASFENATGFRYAELTPLYSEPSQTVHPGIADPSRHSQRCRKGSAAYRDEAAKGD